MTRARTIAVALAAAVAGCATEFTAPSVLDDLRILALVPDPPDAGPGETVTVRPTVYARPDDALASVAWTFCPLTAGSSAAYACAVPACELPLAPAADGSVAVDPSQRALDCAALLAGGPVPADVLPSRVETTFRLVARTAGGQIRTGVARVPLYPRGAPADRNLPPVVSAIEVAGAAVAPGAASAPVARGARVPVTVRIDPASIQAYADATGRTLTETVVVEIFSTAGTVDFDKADAPVAEFQLDLASAGAATEALVHVVARDLRGGQASPAPVRIPLAP